MEVNSLSFLWLSMLLLKLSSTEALCFVHRSNSKTSCARFFPLFLSTYSDDGSPSDYDIEDLVDRRGSRTSRSAVGSTEGSAFNSNTKNSNDEEDASIREALKRELLLLSSITNRGEYATIDEQNVLVDIVVQLEALNPTPQPALSLLQMDVNFPKEYLSSSVSSSPSVWDLCLSSTQFFRCSPFFQSIRAAASEIGENAGGVGVNEFGNSNFNAPNFKSIIDNAFDIHDRATTASRIGRVRQTISPSSNGDNIQLISEVDLEVGVIPGLPFRVKGTVVTTANVVMDSITSDAFELQIVSTRIKNSNVPIVNQLQFLGGEGLFTSRSNIQIPSVGDNDPVQEESQQESGFSRSLNSLSSFFNGFLASGSGAMNERRTPAQGEFPVGQIYESLLGSVPKIPNKTYFLDESMRITRDQDDNFFVFTRA